MGGSDQWGNILAGVDLIRRVTGDVSFAVVFPLITTSSGAKMGKTADGAVWLSSEKTSPYDYYQFWVNTEDPDVGRFLRMFTFLPMAEIQELEALEGRDINRAKQILAFEATRIAHGESAAQAAKDAAQAAFGTATDKAALVAVPSTELSAQELDAGVPVVDLFFRAGLTKSKGDARRLLKQGGVYVNEERVTSADAVVCQKDLADGSILLRAGKKRYHRVLLLDSN
jgi:tyrosyl-tRNA synthetase